MPDLVVVGGGAAGLGAARAAALGGAGVMLVIHAMNADTAFYAEETSVDWNVIFLLMGMMAIVGVVKQIGMSEYLAIWAGSGHEAVRSP